MGTNIDGNIDSQDVRELGKASSAHASSNGASKVWEPIPAVDFYVAGSSGKSVKGSSVDSAKNSRTPPTLPKRKDTAAGSSHTNYFPPSTPVISGPSYSNWREPELVVDELEVDTAMDDDEIPNLIPNDSRNWDGSFSQPNWSAGGFQANTNYQTQNDGSDWLNTDRTWPDSSLLHDAFGSGVAIDGRNEQEEKDWWKLDPSTYKYPGPGKLPPLLTDELHHPDHSLFTVTITTFPDFPPPAASTSSGSSSSLSPPPATLTSSPPSSPKGSTHSRSSSTSSASFVPPSKQECREAIPHPHAYFCRRHNGWVLLYWRSSNSLPPFAASFNNSERYHPLPSAERRKRCSNCVSEESPFSKPNKTHHFHRYEKAVDARHMGPAYIPRTWELAERSKNSRRRMTIGSDHLDPDMLAQAVSGDLQSQKETLMVTDTKELEESRDLLDIYVCCQCSFYVVVSDLIPGVVPNKLLEEFIRDRGENPPAGKNSQEEVQDALETLITVIENKLWRGNNKSLSIGGRKFSQKVGWNSTVQRIFESLRFVLGPSPASTKASSSETALSPHLTLTPPDTDLNSEVGRMNRERLLRAWVELSAYLAEYRRRYATSLKNTVPQKLFVQVGAAREDYQRAIGSHPDQIKRGQLPEQLHGQDVFLGAHWECLGMTQSTYDAELLQFAYLAQCRCDPYRTVEYFGSLVRIVNIMRAVATVPQELETLIIAERSRGRFTYDDFVESTRALGFGSDNYLRVDYEDEMDEEFIRRAWRDAVRRSWNEPEGASKRRDLNEAFRIIAEGRRSALLMESWHDEVTNGMTPDRAYNTLEIPPGVDDEMIITIYHLRIEDQPSQLEKMREALRVIAEFTCSERLQKFLETGSDPGIIVAATRPDWPRGLNQLGNTCYLNSLLQYFYTIKDLREAIAPLAVADQNLKAIDYDKVKDEDLKNHRVGGRVVTRHEVVRSRKFVSQLANLFYNLEFSETPAVTPTLELAKLALVTSKDEEEDDPERGGTDSSHSTDATLVDEPVPTSSIRDSPPPLSKSASPPPSSSAPSSPVPSGASSVLGKRPRGFGRRKTDGSAVESVDDTDKTKDGFILVSKPSSPADSTPASGGTATPVPGNDADGDIEMVESSSAPAASTQVVSANAPPLPPRPKTQTSTSDMMFGKQHDVAECMDNCMFQIETALLRFGELAGSDDNKRSIVKRLFYGKIRQRLSLAPDPARSKSSLHEREDFFSHLPVNVSEESFDLYDGLSGYFDDVVEYEGTKAKMEVSLVELPPILQIQLQRVQFNRETLQPYKSHAYVKFGETICMDRFLDDAPADKKVKAKEIQAELNACRERIAQLTQSKHAPYDQSLEHVHSFLSQSALGLDLPENTDDFKAFLLSEKEHIVQELATARQRVATLKAQLEGIWQDEHRAEYELTSVFVHRGASPTFGHYFIYQRWLPDRPDEWFKYNDSDVSVVSKEDVLADTTGSTANPYLLVFARKGSQVIQTVQRTEADAITIE